MTKQRNPYLDLISPDSLSQSLENLLREFGKLGDFSIPENSPFAKQADNRKQFKLACKSLDFQMGLETGDILSTVRTLYVALLQNHMLSDDTQRSYRPTDD